jgi:hypothetical protein
MTKWCDYLTEEQCCKARQCSVLKAGALKSTVRSTVAFSHCRVDSHCRPTPQFLRFAGVDLTRAPDHFLNVRDDK